MGDRVFNILYGYKYHSVPFGTVTSAWEYDSAIQAQPIGVDYDNDCKAATIANYYVALPPEHDPKALKRDI